MTKNWVISSLIPLMAVVALPACAQNAPAPSSKTKAVSTEYMPKDYAYLYGMPGFADALLKMHFQLYLGYVKNTNLLLGRLGELVLQDKDQTYDYGALKRRLGWEWNGMRLHELYFDNLGGQEPLDKSDPLYQKIVKDFGSYELWKKSFVSTGLIRGIGWVILYNDPQTGRLMNTWINEHDLGHLAGGEPLLVMDVFEHAYITQYGLDRAKYINAFFDNIEWSNVSKRYKPQE
jgi:Fe-Mn family superoxide dismutase